MSFSCVSPHVSVGSAPKHVQEFRTTLLHQNSVCTWTKCTTKSQRIIGSLWWASCAIPHCCQIVACVSKWERRRTQTGSRPAVYSSGWGLCSACVRTLLDMHRRRTCAELSNEILIASSTIHRIWTQSMKVRKISAQWVPRCTYVTMYGKLSGCISLPINMEVKPCLAGSL